MPLFQLIQPRLLKTQRKDMSIMNWLMVENYICLHKYEKRAGNFSVKFIKDALALQGYKSLYMPSSFQQAAPGVRLARLLALGLACSESLAPQVRMKK